MYLLPVKYEVDETMYYITDKGDYHMILDCFKAFDDVELSKQDRIITSLIIFYENFNTVEDVLGLSTPTIATLVDDMYSFINGGSKDFSQGINTKHKLVDWESDSQLLCSAINNVAHVEIRALDYLHWWTFLGYYMAIGQCAFSEIVQIRHKILTNEKLEKYERKFKRENPQYFAWNCVTSDKQKDDEYIKQLWNSNSTNNNE